MDEGETERASEQAHWASGLPSSCMPAGPMHCWAGVELKGFSLQTQVEGSARAQHEEMGSTLRSGMPLRALDR